MQAGIPLLNLATEPLRASEIYECVYQEPFVNELPRPIPRYDFRTAHADLFGGRDGYIFSKEQVLLEIEQFLREWNAPSQVRDEG